MQNLVKSLAAMLMIVVFSAPAIAATSDVHRSDPVDAQLISAQNGVAPNANQISAGLHLTLNQDWKTYWRSPGEVGLPPEISWEGSENLKNVTFLWPAPKRFTAFGIENFGYEKSVTFPLQVELETPGAPARLNAEVNILVCSDVCVPAMFSLRLDLPTGNGIDGAAAILIADGAARVPGDGADRGITADAYVVPDQSSLVIAINSQQAFNTPDVFPEGGEFTAFGRPDIRLSDDAKTLWASLPILADYDPEIPLRLTIADQEFAATFTPQMTQTAPTPPYEKSGDGTGRSNVVGMILLAILGGLILNVMPCVLPVLSIKLSSAIKMQGASDARIRKGFLASALGIFAFMWVLALATILARMAGLSVGWGLQFQSPYFLIALTLLIAAFAANMFGLFEISLPSRLQTKMSNADGGGYVGDFATGAFAAVLATPCSAPFLGTAVAFALSGSVIDIVLIFTALGFGLALPYFGVAARPSLLRLLPKPGRWMVWLRIILGGMLLATALWLLSVLVGVSGVLLALWVAIFASAMLAVIALKRLSTPSRPILILITVTLAFLSPIFISPKAEAVTINTSYWQPFDRAEIAREVSQGRVVFVDVTADWCLTCLANKRLVLDRDPVASELATDVVTAMKADWTRPDPKIAAYLESFDRFGIPFNAVYGPNAPNGIALPEILTPDAVLSAITQAGG